MKTERRRWWIRERDVHVRNHHTEFILKHRTVQCFNLDRVAEKLWIQCVKQFIRTVKTQASAHTHTHTPVKAHNTTRTAWECATVCQHTLMCVCKWHDSWGEFEQQSVFKVRAVCQPQCKHTETQHCLILAKKNPWTNTHTHTHTQALISFRHWGRCKCAQPPWTLYIRTNIPSNMLKLWFTSRVYIRFCLHNICNTWTMATIEGAL